MTGLLQQWRIRRPFSRKVRLTGADVLDPVRRRDLEALIGRITLGQPVPASVKVLCLIYGGDYAGAAALIEQIAGSGRRGDYARMLAESNFRKLMLGCYRDAAGKGPLPRPAADLLLKFSQVVDPELQRIFRPCATNKAAQRLRFDYAPLPQRLRVTLFFRRFFFGSESRRHDMGPRIKAAFDQAGVECRLLDPNLEAFDFAPCDLALVDDSAMFRKDANEKAAFLDRLRKSTSRIGMVDLDHWMTHFGHRLAAGSERYDFVWTMAPLRLVDGAIDGKRACVIPFPIGFERELQEVASAPAADALRFCGAIEDYNFHRYFWLLANYGFARPFEADVTRHNDDGLSVVESLRAYFRRLTAARAALNFTMRADGQTMMVGRTSDVLGAGRLLVQEAAEDMTCYFDPGTHFLEFSNVDELQALVARLHEPATEEVRRSGAAFFAEAYSNVATVRHLMSFL